MIWVVAQDADSTQAELLDSLLIKHERFNFPSSDNPAFKMVDLEPSQVLRPSNPEEIAINLSEFSNGTSVIIPKDFGMLVSPAMLIKSQMKKPTEWAKAWQPLRVAVAASRSENGGGTGEFAGNFAVGLQYTLIDKSGEIYFKEKLRKDLETIIKPLSQHRPRLEQAFVDSLRKTDSTISRFSILNDPNLLKDMNQFVLQHYQQESGKSYQMQIKSAKTKWKAQNWAAQRLDIAAAASWHTSDPQTRILNFGSDTVGVVVDTITNDTTYLTNITGDTLVYPGFTVFRKFNAFMTYTLPFPNGKNAKDSLGNDKNQWGMLMIGANYGGTFLDDTTSTTLAGDSVPTLETTTTFFSQLTVNSRFYVGSNRFKGYVEAQAYWDGRISDKVNWLADLGLELNIVDGVWVNVYAGATNQGIEQFVSPTLEENQVFDSFAGRGKPRFLANFDIRLSIPENWGKN